MASGTAHVSRALTTAESGTGIGSTVVDVQQFKLFNAPKNSQRSGSRTNL